MEKFSAYRDPGTGVQPFLTPVPPLGSDLLGKVTIPLQYFLGTIRTLIVLALLLLYVVLVPGVCGVFKPIPPLHRAVSHLFIALIARTVLLVLGFFWISPEQVKRKRGRGQNTESWNPRAGDIIVSNWVSWIELLWLAVRQVLRQGPRFNAEPPSFRFDPIFVLPVSDRPPMFTKPYRDAAPISHTPGRRTGTGSANIATPQKSTSSPISILGFRPVSLLTIIRLTGQIPPFGFDTGETPQSLEELREKAGRPIVVFPECTTSNGRGLLRFAKVFREQVPVKRYQVFVMCVRYDPPTSIAPTLTHSIPTITLNPLSHLFSLASSVTLPTISLRLLAPSEAPSSQLFVASEIIADSVSHDDNLTEVCASLISQIGKMKQVGMGWEDKANFLDFYRDKRKS